MKRTWLALLIIINVLFLLGTAQTAKAVLLYYTFEGVVTSDHVDHDAFEDWSGIPVDEQLYLGDYAYHTVLIDYDPTLPIVQYGQQFSAEYILGNSMWIPTYDFGYNASGGIAVPGVLFSTTAPWDVGDAFFTIYSWDLTVYDWTVGTQVVGHAFGGVIGGQDQDLWLRSISDKPPMQNNAVPEPATVLLLVSGLAGFAGFRRKFRKH